ncbi:hypothetical protein J7T55_010878 [Diaporthe amygdali]|uniref:uncharacterized protein n=1 Tax=Phomopsis amygdali TaxID=1214568 RepID=UPI0022FEB4CA|nr:uncharacterized protein J7T55_010878 [Diaporthe amygdali]KAJ0104414.1 hypothetical protein J7T55_010878 [Diaporthe amygdali]
MRPVPDEIWHQIFSHHQCVLVEDKWWFSTVWHCLLYTKLSFSKEAIAKRRDMNILPATLAAGPNLGLHTRTITLDDADLPPTFVFGLMIQKLLKSLELPTTLRKHIETRLEEDARYNYYSSRYVGVAVFILALTPGRSDMTEQLMQDTEKGDSDTEEDRIDEETRKDDAVNLSAHEMAGASFANYGLPDLEELRLRTGDCTDNSTYIHSIEAALLHPNLKVLRLLGIDWLQKSLRLLKWPDEPCSVQLLELKENLIEASSLRHIFSRFTSLRTLLIHLADCRRYMYDTDEIEWEVYLNEFGSILRELGQDLVEFSLHTTNFESDGICEGHLGSLREMRSLRHLKVIYTDLVNTRVEPSEQVSKLVDVLPPSLETLHLHWDDRHCGQEYYKRRCEYVNQGVTELLEHGHMPNLRQVSIERYYNETMEGEFDGPIGGWDMTVENVHLWATYSSSGCMRTIVTFTRSY